MYRKLPQSVGGNTLNEMIMMTIGDNIKTKDPPDRRGYSAGETLMEKDLPEENTLVEDPLIETEDPQ